MPETPDSKLQKAKQDICETPAIFLGPENRNEKVYWRFEILGSCPSPKSSLRVFILSAEYVEKIKQYVYPGYVREPQIGKRYQIQVLRDTNRSEWIISDWNGGVRALP